MQGIALAIAWLAAAFWITIGLDWWIEPPPQVRMIMIGCVSVVFVYLIYRYILRRAFVRLADTNLAMLLERRFKGLGDSLLTTVEMADHPEHATDFNTQMLSNTQGEALSHLPEVRLADVFRFGPLIGSIVAAVVGIASVAAFAFFMSGAFRIWVDRSLMFLGESLAAPHAYLDRGLSRSSNQDRQGLGCEDHRQGRHALCGSRDCADPLSCRRRQGPRKEHEPPGNQGEDESFQEYAFVFQGIPSSRTFDLVGGDMTLRGFQIDVVDVPAIEVTLNCVFPAYMHRERASCR